MNVSPNWENWPDAYTRSVDPESWSAQDSVALHARLLAAVDTCDGDPALKTALVVVINQHAPVDDSASDGWASCTSCLDGGDNPKREAHPCEETIGICEALGVPPRPVVIEETATKQIAQGL